MVLIVIHVVSDNVLESTNPHHLKGALATDRVVVRWYRDWLPDPTSLKILGQTKERMRRNRKTVLC